MIWDEENQLCKVFGENNGLKHLPPGLTLFQIVPLSDEKSEGVWENTNLNSESKFLRWSDKQPCGSQTEIMLPWKACIIETSMLKNYTMQLVLVRKLFFSLEFQ